MTVGRRVGRIQRSVAPGGLWEQCEVQVRGGEAGGLPARPGGQAWREKFFSKCSPRVAASGSPGVPVSSDRGNRMPQAGWLNKQILFLTVLEAECTRWFSFWWEPPSWLGGSYHVTMSSPVCLHIRTWTLLGQGPTHMISFNLNYFLRGTVSKHRQVESYSFNMDFRGTQASDPLTPENLLGLQNLGPHSHTCRVRNSRNRSQKSVF